MKRVLVATGGGDCPGLNAVIRAIVKRAKQERDREVVGSIQSFDGILHEPTEMLILDGKGNAIIVIAEDAASKGGDLTTEENNELVYENLRLEGVSHQPIHDLKKVGFEADMRETVLGHLQRGGIPIAYDRILAKQFGINAFAFKQLQAVV